MLPGTNPWISSPPRIMAALGLRESTGSSTESWNRRLPRCSLFHRHTDHPGTHARILPDVSTVSWPDHKPPRTDIAASPWQNPDNDADNRRHDPVPKISGTFTEGRQAFRSQSGIALLEQGALVSSLGLIWKLGWKSGLPRGYSSILRRRNDICMEAPCY